MAALAVVVIAILFRTGGGGFVVAPGGAGTAFGLLMWIALAYAVWSSETAAVDTLSLEKREGTIELLRLTPLSDWGIAWGTCAGRFLAGAQSILAAAPMAVVLILGGALTWAALFKGLLASLNLLWCLLATGLLASALFSRTGTVRVLNFFWMLVFWAGGAAVIGTLLSRFFGWDEIRPGPFHAWSMATAPGREFRFWMALGGSHLLSWLALGASAIGLRRTWRARLAPAFAPRARLSWRQRFFTRRSIRWRNRMLAIHPWVWLQNRARGRVWAVWVLLAGIGLAGGLFIFAWPRPGVGRLALFSGVLMAAAKYLAAWEAGRRILDHRRMQRIEDLLSVSLSNAEIVRGEYIAFRRFFAAPAAAVVVVAVVSAWLVSKGGGNSTQIMLVTSAMVLVFLLDLEAVMRSGLRHGRTARTAGDAAGAACKAVLLAPWAALFAWIVLLLLASTLYPEGWAARVNPFDIPMLFCAWVIFSVAADVGYGRWDRQRLVTTLRSEAV